VSGGDVLYEPVVRRLALADDVFVHLLGRSGRLLAGRRPAGIVLAAALMAELLLWRQLHITGETLTVGGGTPACPILAAMVREMAAETAADPDLTVTDWVSFEADAAEEAVASRLAAHGVIDIQQGLALLGRPRRYRTRDFQAVAWAPMRLAEPIAHRAVLNDQDTALVSLLTAAGLGELVLRPGRLYATNGDAAHLVAITGYGEASNTFPGLGAITGAVARLAGAAAVSSH
jgi:hypothetical protein